MMRRIVFSLFALLAGWSPVAADTAPVTPTHLSFGVVPQQSARTLARLWSPILDYLGEKTGLALRFETAPDIPAFEQRLARGEYDLAYMNPYHYAIFSQAPGYGAFAKEKDRRIEGIIVVRRDGRYRTLADLRGATVAFPAPAAFAATVLPLAQLRQEGIAVAPKYVSSHDSVYLSVAKGLYPAGGGIRRTLEAAPAELRAELRILWATRPYTPHAIAAHPRVAPDTVRRLQRAMTDMHRDPRGRRLLEALAFKGLEPAADSDWDDVRALDIHLLDKLLKGN